MRPWQAAEQILSYYFLFLTLSFSLSVRVLDSITSTDCALLTSLVLRRLCFLVDFVQ